MIEWMLAYPGYTTIIVVFALCIFDHVMIAFFRTFRKHESNEEKQEKNSDDSDTRWIILSAWQWVDGEKGDPLWKRVSAAMLIGMYFVAKIVVLHL